MSGISIRVVTELKEFKSLFEVWNALLQMSGGDNSIYITHEWLSTWWMHFGKGRKLNILLLEKGHRVIGIFPLMRTEYRIGLAKYNFLEIIGTLDCNYLGIIPPQHSEEIVSALLAYLQEQLDKNKLVLRLTQVPDDSKFLDLLRRSSFQFSRRLFIQETTMNLAPYILLPANWEDYFHSLSRNMREMLHRKLRTLEKRHSVGFQVCTTDTLEDSLNEFFHLHQKRWQSVNVSGIFSDPRMKEFYRDIANQFIKKNWLHFSLLTIDGGVVSARYCFLYNGRFYDAILARDIEYSYYNVGHIHTMYLIKDAIARNLREFDFLSGAEPYKFHWTKSSRKYLHIIVIKRGLCPRLRLKFLGILLRLHEIRQYGLKEIYPRYMIRRREERERKKMGGGTLV
jgi:CelD/BcsL family acetyltransferase involved in cellulose biosynthesis